VKEIEFPKPVRDEAIASLKHYIEENLAEPIGDLKAGALLNFFLEEIGPAVYNQAVRDAQTLLQQRVMDMDGELFADAFQYWPRMDRERKARRSR
jgi:uncharacterized protein (DUF2164 family)